MSTVTKTFFSKNKEGEDVSLFTIKNSLGASVGVIDLGVTVQSIIVNDRNGRFDDIALGFDSAAEYQDTISYYGATVGRVANRIGGASFLLNGKKYELQANDNANTLHSADGNLAFKMYEATIIEDGVKFVRLSPDGEGGYPGNAIVTVTVTFDDSNTLTFDYRAVADEDTLFAMTNHSFFNLGGHHSGTILKDKLMINSDFITPITAEVMPDGTVAKVDGTPFDFRTAKEIGQDINADNEQIKFGGGFDHNFMLKKTEPGKFELAATLENAQTGRYMECYTTKPAMQFYSGNFITPDHGGKNGEGYPYRGALCLETQYVPNGMAVNHLGTPILRKGEVYHHVTSYKFSVK